jgi:prepilin peptidase CpaA
MTMYPSAEAFGRLPMQPYLILPLGLALWIGWRDLKTRRIPNYLTCGVALSGLVFQLAQHGWGGLWTGSLGLLLGFGLLFLPYLLGGMGAGDVKALAGLGAWLGPHLVIYLFVYMAISGALIALGLLCWRGKLWSRILQARTSVLNWIICRSHGLAPAAASTSKPKSESIPYGVAMALGMVLLLIWGA